MPAFSLSYASFSLPLPTPRFWSAWTRLPVHLTTHQPGFSVPAQLLLSLFLKTVSLSPSLKEPSRYLLDETFQWNATSPCLALKKKNHKKLILVFKLCRAGGTGCFWKSSAFLVTASTGSQRVFFFNPVTLLWQMALKTIQWASADATCGIYIGNIQLPGYNVCS